MYEQINAQFVNLTKQFADSALKANALAFENFERVVGLQMKTLEDRTQATIAFFGEAAEAHDLESAKTLWPKGVQVARENAERFYQAQQEAIGQTIKTQEAIGQLVRSQFEAAGEQATRAAKAATKPAAK